MDHLRRSYRLDRLSDYEDRRPTRNYLKHRRRYRRSRARRLDHERVWPRRRERLQPLQLFGRLAWIGCLNSDCESNKIN